MIVLRKIKYKKTRNASVKTPKYNGKYQDYITDMQLFVYNDNVVNEFKSISFESFLTEKKDNLNNWLNVHGLTNTDLISEIVKEQIDETTIIYDILNTNNSTRLDELDGALFISVKSILADTDAIDVTTENISFLLKKNTIISFQEKRGDFFTYIRERLNLNNGIVRKRNVDYLLFLLLESIIENFYVTLESNETKLESLLKAIKIANKVSIIEEIENQKEVFYLLKQNIIPLKDALNTIKDLQEDDDFNLIEKQNFIYYKRLLYKIVEILDQIDYNIRSIESASNYYFTIQNHKMNEVMKTLTVISSIFLPLTFIAGIYGMNFDNMPGVKLDNGFFVLVFVMICIMLFMVMYFKKKKWF